MDDGDFRKARFRRRYVSMTPADQDAFCLLLRDKYPTAIFGKADAKNEKLVLYSSIKECPFSCSVWIPEPGWTPQFGYTSAENRLVGLRSLLNTPRRGLRYVQSLPARRYISEYSDHALPGRPLDSSLTRFIRQGEIQGSYYEDEPAVKNFLTWVFNMTRRLWTNRFQVIDLETDKVIEVWDGHFQWCGPDAARLCEEDPNFFIHVWNEPHYGTLVGTKALPREAPKRKTSRPVKA